MAKILLVEDDKVMALTIITTLESEHHSVEHVVEGQEALMMLKLSKYDLVILDWALPDLSGIEILSHMRKNNDSTAVIMLTARELESDKETGLDTGADDYITKPFSLKELAARIRAILRRTAGQSANIIEVGNLTLNLQNHQFLKDGEEIDLLPQEFALMEFLMLNQNEVFSANTILERVWHSHSESTAEAVRTCVKRLRRKLDDKDASIDDSIIETVPKVGYRLRQKS